MCVLYNIFKITGMYIVDINNFYKYHYLCAIFVVKNFLINNKCYNARLINV